VCDNQEMKKATPSKGRRPNAKGRAMLAFLEELRRSTNREDVAVWTQLHRDLKTNRLILSGPGSHSGKPAASGTTQPGLPQASAPEREKRRTTRRSQSNQ